MAQIFGGDFYLTFKARDLDMARLIASEIVRKFNVDGGASFNPQTLLPTEEDSREISYFTSIET